MSDAPPPAEAASTEGSTPPTSAPKVTYRGNCHCGAVRYTLRSPDLTSIDVIECNCSICSRNGYLFVYIEDADLDWERGRGDVKEYLFAGRRIGHYFCPTCGTSVFAKSVTQEFYPDHTAVNLRTVEGLDEAKLTKKAVDGKAVEPAYEI